MRRLMMVKTAPAISESPSGIVALNRLVVPFEVKAAATDDSARTFEGILAVWDKDLGDDIIHKGAFKKTIAAWKKSKDALPLVNSHDHFDIFAAIGQALELEETDDGLWSKWEVIEGEDGDRVLARLRPSARTKRAVIGKMSIGYEPVKFDYERSDEARFGQIRHLREVDLKEGSLVMFPMAPGAVIDARSVKSFLDLAARTEPSALSAETKTDLRKLAARIGNLLSPNRKDEPPAPSPEPPTPAPAAPPATPPATSPDPATPPAPAPPVTADPPVPPTPTVPDTAQPPAPEGKGAPVIYEMQEALQQRVKKSLLKSTIAEVTNTNR